MATDRGNLPSWQRKNLTYGAGLTLDRAKRMLDAAENEAKKRGVLAVMAIVDAGGHLVAFRRMDGAMLLSIQIATDKAYIAAFGKVPTQVWGELFRPDRLFALYVHERLVTLAGGFPLIDNNVLLGGWGASGGYGHEDLYIAKAALEAGGFSLDDVETALKKYH